MIDKRVYELDYIRELQKKYVSDPGLIERPCMPSACWKRSKVSECPSASKAEPA